MPIHLQTDRKSGLHKVLAACLSRLKYRTRRPHRLLILSCYIHFDALKKLILAVKGALRLEQVHLAFEFKEAFRGRLPNEMLADLEALEAWCLKRDIALQWQALRGGALMHAKGYVVLQLSHGEPADGVVLLGSANATLPGFGLTAADTPPNVEILHVSHDEEDVSDFLKVWDELLLRSGDLSRAAERADAYEFAYGLLASGVFLHDWRESLNAKIGVRYSLTSEGRLAIPMNLELRAFGFEIDQATISRNPLAGLAIPRPRELPRTFAKKYTVDTLVGLWCPRSVWSVVEEVVEGEAAFQAFHAAFLEATDASPLDVAYDAECSLSAQLVQRGLVVDDPTRLPRWRLRIESLRGDRDKLARIYKKLQAFELPYDYQARAEVLEVWESLLETLGMKRKRSFTARKVQDAESEGDLDMLLLSDEEEQNLRKELVA